MFLLKPHDRKLHPVSEREFTFHNVSIKTLLNIEVEADIHNLHSTMFLLKLSTDGYIKGTLQFTFHNVSIKTLVERIEGVNKFDIYIPQCFY